MWPIFVCGEGICEPINVGPPVVLDSTDGDQRVLYDLPAERTHVVFIPPAISFHPQVVHGHWLPQGRRSCCRIHSSTARCCSILSSAAFCRCCRSAAISSLRPKRVKGMVILTGLPIPHTSRRFPLRRLDHSLHVIRADRRPLHWTACAFFLALCAPVLLVQSFPVPQALDPLRF